MRRALNQQWRDKTGLESSEYSKHIYTYIFISLQIDRDIQHTKAQTDIVSSTKIIGFAIYAWYY